MIPIRKHWTRQDVEEILLLSQDIISLNTKVHEGEDDETELEFFIEDTAPNPEELIIQGATRNKLLTYMDKYLSEREATILKQRFGFETEMPMTLNEVGNALGITRERVRQLEAKALRKLRARFMRNNLKREDI